MNEQERLQEHVRMCPLGWDDGLLMMSRKSTGKDVIAWLARLRVLVGLDTDDTEGDANG